MKSAIAVLIVLFPLIHSTVPPESYDLLPKLASEQGGDTTLDKWLEEFKENKNVFELSSRPFLEAIKEFDEITRVYLRLRYNHVNNLTNQTARTRALELVFGNSDAFNSHPLKPYLYEEVLEMNGLDEKKSQLVLNKLVNEGSNSCPHKQIILKEIESDGFKSQSNGYIRDMIQSINQFRSKSFRKQVVEELAEVLGEEGLTPLIPDLKPILKDLKSLDLPDEIMEKFAMDIASASYSPEMQDLADYLRTSVRNRQCHKAKSKLVASIGQLKEMEDLSKAEPLINKVESCYRSKGNQSRISFWIAMQSTLKSAYAFNGEILALKKQGAIYWLIDEFAKAKEIFTVIQKMALAKQDATLEAYALYTLGRVAENEGDDNQAISFYDAYADKFKKGENIDEVYMSLILLNFHAKRYDRALAMANRVIDIQNAMPEAARNGGTLSYAYFWAGRAAVRVNKREIAMAMWRRAASEYYSTFYGAMGHYMYEQLQGAEYHLEPSRSAVFRPDSFLARFSFEDRKILDRSSLLLKAGLKADANCEIMELITDNDKDNDRVLMKSLLLHAAGDWLEAVKAYSDLPRSYRSALPSGFERLLFPKAYINDVEELAGKLNLEPEIIFGIIRQESVFNPRAASPAGARGLMQLMPATARYESKRLSRSYLPYKTRLRIQRSMRNRNSLFVPYDNIALGVHHVYRLLKKYKNPVFVLTSYNANPRATERWTKKMSTDDLLTFMERIPYQETRLYVKLVMRNYFFYKKWYENKERTYPYLENIVAPDLEILRANSQKG